jgi:hypothetical protein
MRLPCLLLAAAMLCAAAPQPATLGPPVTGSMYDGNNAHPAPRTQQSQQGNEAAGGAATTGAQNKNGHGAAHGGAG